MLHVEVDHPGWATEIRYLEHGIIERLAELMPDAGIESMRVSVGRNR